MERLEELRLELINADRRKARMLFLKIIVFIIWIGAMLNVFIRFALHENITIFVLFPSCGYVFYSLVDYVYSDYAFKVDSLKREIENRKSWEGMIQKQQKICESCHYYNGGGYVKCAVHPTEQLIDCSDYKKNKKPD